MSSGLTDTTAAKGTVFIVSRLSNRSKFFSVIAAVCAVLAAGSFTLSFDVQLPDELAAYVEDGDWHAVVRTEEELALLIDGMIATGEVDPQSVDGQLMLRDYQDRLRWIRERRRELRVQGALLAGTAVLFLVAARLVTRRQRLDEAMI